MSNQEKKSAYVAAKFPPQQFAIVPFELLKCCSERGVKAKALTVLLLHCFGVDEYGRLRRISQNEITEKTGLSQSQVKRALAELRDLEIIEWVSVKTKTGVKCPDKSRKGHIGQYKLTPELWNSIPKEATPQPTTHHPMPDWIEARKRGSAAS